MLENLGIFKDNNDGTLKCTFKENNKNIIEMSLLMNREDTDVVCVPTHHFCNLGCKMCHLTNNSLNKAMVPINIDSFVESLKRAVCSQTTGKRRTNKRILLLSFMGVGEPLLNIKLISDVYDLQEKLKKELDYDYIGYALATMIPSEQLFVQLKETVLKKHIPLKIHFSLHTPINENRQDLIPSTNVSVKNAMKLLDDYNNQIKKDEKIMKVYKSFHSTIDVVEIHYTLINNVNDGEKELNKIIQLLKEYNFTIKFINFNPKEELIGSNKLTYWQNVIRRNTLSRVKFYCPPGKEVGSSCGEFTKHYYHEEIETLEQKEEFEKWYKSHIIYD